MRKFKPPACEAAWDERLGASLPSEKIWRITSTFATPRDQLTGLKLVYIETCMCSSRCCGGYAGASAWPC